MIKNLIEPKTFCTACKAKLSPHNEVEIKGTLYKSGFCPNCKTEQLMSAEKEL